MASYEKLTTDWSELVVGVGLVQRRSGSVYVVRAAAPPAADAIGLKMDSREVTELANADEAKNIYARATHGVAQVYVESGNTLPVAEG